MKTNFSEYLEGLSSGGKVLETGQSFVVHLAKSREKMATFQTQEPAYCFLKWYQAAVAGGAQEIYFEMDLEHYTMIIPFAQEIELAEICNAYEGQQSNLCRRDRLFLEGLLASTSADMETSISTDSESHVLSATGLAKPGWWSRLSGFRKVYKENSVRLSLRVKYTAAARAKIIQTIQDRTRFGPVVPYFVLDPAGRTRIDEKEVPLFFDEGGRAGWHKLYSRNDYLLEAWEGEGGPLYRERKLRHSRPNPKRYPQSLLRQELERGEVSLLIGLQLEGQSQAIPVQEGVTLEPLRVDLGCPGVTLAFSADGMKTDLSGFKLSENEVLTARLEELRGTVGRIVEKSASGVENLTAREVYGLNPAGLLVGAGIGFIYGMSMVSDAVVFFVVVAALLGWVAEQIFRRKELRQAREARTLTFRAEVWKRLTTPTKTD